MNARTARRTHPNGTAHQRRSGPSTAAKQPAIAIAPAWCRLSCMPVGAQYSMCQKVRSIAAPSSRRAMFARVSNVQIHTATPMAIRLRMTAL